MNVHIVDIPLDFKFIMEKNSFECLLFRLFTVRFGIGYSYQAILRIKRRDFGIVRNAEYYKTVI